MEPYDRMFKHWLHNQFVFINTLRNRPTGEGYNESWFLHREINRNLSSFTPGYNRVSSGGGYRVVRKNPYRKRHG